MKDLVRIVCVLIVGLLVACGGGGESSGTTSNAPVTPDTRLVMDSIAWDQADWAE